MLITLAPGGGILMVPFNQYPTVYPYLPVELILFFEIESEGGAIKEKYIYGFIDYYRKKYNTQEPPQPSHISRICDVLVKHGNLSLLSQSGPDNISNSYCGSIKNKKEFIDNFDFYNRIFNCLIYGFPYIYEITKKYVVPIIHYGENDEEIGTGFYFDGGIATAKHCIEGARKIAIKGISKDELEKCTIYIHDNEVMDIAFIKMNNQIKDTITYYQDANILDEVLTLGYPKIAGFHNFLTAEKANISARFTATTGHIAASAKDIWIKENLLLITAKVKGGNSGGPIIASNGAVVGITSQEPCGEGSYDNLGYGTVIPIKYLIEILSNPQKTLDASSITFVDFSE